MREVPSGQGVVTRTKRQECDEPLIATLSRGTEAASRCCRRLPPVASQAGGGLFFMPKNKIHELVLLGILTGLAVLLSYVFAIQTPFVRITSGFCPSHSPVLSVDRGKRGWWARWIISSVPQSSGRAFSSRGSRCLIF